VQLLIVFLSSKYGKKGAAMAQCVKDPSFARAVSEVESIGHSVYWSDDVKGE